MKNEVCNIDEEFSVVPDDSTTPPPWGETRVVGKPLPRIDAYERVSGSAVYTLDMILPEMLYAAVVRCPHAHARVKRVDTSGAERMPGVHAVITGASPGAAIPWHAGGKGPTSVLFDSHCRFAGEEVAAVAAETPQQAYDAVRAVSVEYETLPFVVDFEEALKPEAPAVHGGGNRVRDTSVRERGNIQTGFSEADVVLEETYRTSFEIHTPMETHGSVALWEENRLTVWDSTQGVFGIQESLAQALHLPLSSVRVICRYMGGGFGSKLELGKYTVIAALLARSTARPVKLVLSREESFLSEGNRPANIIKLKAGVKKDGTLKALHAVFHGGVGAYPSGGTSSFQAWVLYQFPNIRVEETSVYSHTGKARAFRAPGFPQCSWALEQMMDAIAEKIGMDPVEFRLKNLAAAPSSQQKIEYTSNALKECLTQGAKAFGWKAASTPPPRRGSLLRGVGVAAGMWGYQGDPRSTAILKLFPDGSANLNFGASDIGTGTKTVMAMVVSEELGVPLTKIQIEHADTATTQFAPGSGGSQTILVNAPAVRAAALDVKRQLLEIAAEEMKVAAGGLILRDGRVMPANDPEKSKLLSELKGLEDRQVLVGIGRRHPHPKGKIALPFAAQFAEVEVNENTGEMRVVRFLAAHDSGRVMNRLTYENQVFGGVTMGIGFGLTEQRQMDKQTGKMVNANWHDYKIPTAKDVPTDLTCLPVDPHDTECNTTGAKGLGEPATIPTAAAIANAIYNATGIRVTRSPITPVEMVRMLTEKRGGH